LPPIMRKYRTEQHGLFLWKAETAHQWSRISLRRCRVVEFQCSLATRINEFVTAAIFSGSAELLVIRHFGRSPRVRCAESVANRTLGYLSLERSILPPVMRESHAQQAGLILSNAKKGRQLGRVSLRQDRVVEFHRANPFWKP
jgi:hypothetical protein